jgi:hypothetical protein
MTNNLIPLATFFVGIMAVQHFNRKAMLTLSVEDKARLVDYASGFAIWRLLPIIVLIFGFSGFMYLKPSIGGIKMGLLIYLMLILGVSIVSSLILQKKYRKLGLPENYIRTTLIGSAATIVFMIGYFAWIAIPIIKIHG